MKFWLALGFVPETDQLLDIAEHAEAVGFHGVTLADHLIMPTSVNTPYPYTPNGATFWPQETAWPDPFVTLSAMGARTQKLKLLTNIYLGALRDPFTVAKAVATTSVLSQGRVICGMAAGWLKEEFDLMGIDFKSRGRRLNELMEVLPLLWSGEAVEYHGEHYDFPEVILRPAPEHPVPIWTGGGSPAALRRATQRAQGWLALWYSPDEIPAVTARVRELLDEAGRGGDHFDILCGLKVRHTPEIIGQAEEHGITGIVQTPWPPGREDSRSLDGKKRYMDRYAEAIIGPCS